MMAVFMKYGINVKTDQDYLLQMIFLAIHCNNAISIFLIACVSYGKILNCSYDLIYTDFNESNLHIKYRYIYICGFVMALVYDIILLIYKYLYNVLAHDINFNDTIICDMIITLLFIIFNMSFIKSQLCKYIKPILNDFWF